MQEDLTERMLESEEVFSGRLLHVFRDKVSLPNGSESTREYIKHGGASAVVPLTDDGKIITVAQYRYPFERMTIEIPAGKIDPGEDPSVTARRELEEETGCTADEIIPIGVTLPSVAYTNEVIYLYLARGLHFGAQHTDSDEFVYTEKYTLDELVDMIMEDKIRDAKTQSAIFKTKEFLSREGKK